MPEIDKTPEEPAESPQESQEKQTVLGKILGLRRKPKTMIGILFLLYFLYQYSGLYPYLTSSCPVGQIMEHWTEYQDGRVNVQSCMIPRPCAPGKKLSGYCGAFADRTSCSMSCRGENDYSPVLKPVIYLYPQDQTETKVRLDYHGEIIVDYPSYNTSIGGWDVIAHPDGKIINKADNKEYSYLFWEGIPSTQTNWDLTSGFVVKGSDTVVFLQDILPKIGLTPKEYNEFIVYWYPLIKNNPYNLIHFAQKEYTDTAPLNTVPKYDSLLRVFMVAKPLEKPIEVLPQGFKPFERKGFTVVEWGGTVVK